MKGRNDILRQKGIIPEKPPDPEPLIQEALVEAEQKAYENRLEDKDLDELDELEDEEDEAFLEQYRYAPNPLPNHGARHAAKLIQRQPRQKRLQELTTLQQTSVHNQVYPLQKPDYAREVTEASSKYFVLVHLSSPGGNVESRVLSELWRQAAAKFGDVKFCEIRADLCIEGYPEKNTPTILVYREGQILKQMITLRELNGAKTGMAGRLSLSCRRASVTGANLLDIERMLFDLGAVKESDVRLKKRSGSDDEDQKADDNIEDYDDDWD